MNHAERIFKWIDIIRWSLYGLIAGAVGMAVWSTKIQMTLNDLEKQINGMEQNSAIHRDALKEKEAQAEHRFTANEKDIDWLKEMRRANNDHANR